MSQPYFTRSATVSGQRGGVPHWITVLLVEEGARTPARNGRQFVYFDSAARARVTRRARNGEFPIGKLDHAWDVWAVVTRGNTAVLGVGHRDRRVRHR